MASDSMFDQGLGGILGDPRYKQGLARLRAAAILERADIDVPGLWKHDRIVDRLMEMAMLGICRSLGADPDPMLRHAARELSEGYRALALFRHEDSSELIYLYTNAAICAEAGGDSGLAFYFTSQSLAHGPVPLEEAYFVTILRGFIVADQG